MHILVYIYIYYMFKPRYVHVLRCGVVEVVVVVVVVGGERAGPASPAERMCLPLPAHHRRVLVLLGPLVVLQGNAGLVRGAGLDLIRQLGRARLPLQELLRVVPL